MLLLLAWLLPASGVVQAQTDSELEFPWEKTIGIVRVFSDFDLATLNGLQSDIEELQDDLINYLGVPRPQEEIHLFLFSNSEGYLRYIHKRWPGAPLDRPALYVKDRGPGSLMIRKDNQILLNVRHEMTHAILNASLMHVPIWLDEGLAKYFEVPRGKRGFENPFLSTVRQNTTFLFFSRAPSLERLEHLSQVQQMGEREYRESWAWVHFLIHYSQETHYLLAEYLASLRPEYQSKLTAEQVADLQKSSPLTARLKEQFPDYKKIYVAHFKNWEKK